MPTDNEVVTQPAQVAEKPVEAVEPSQVATATVDSSDATQVDNTVDSTTTEPVDSTIVKEPSKKNKAQERIEDLVAEKNAAKEYAEYWRSKALEVINQERPTQQQQQVAQTVQEDKEPTLAEHNFDQDAWSKSFAAWTKRQMATALSQELRNQQTKAQQQSIAEQFQERIDAFRQDHSDFDVVVANPRLPQLDRVAAAMVVSSEKGADITYALAKDPALATRISRMSAPQQALAIGRLEVELSKPQVQEEPPKAAPKAVVTQTTKAPPPPTPVPAGGIAEPSPADMGVGEWMKFRNSQARATRRGGRLA